MFIDRLLYMIINESINERGKKKRNKKKVHVLNIIIKKKKTFIDKRNSIPKDIVRKTARTETKNTHSFDFKWFKVSHKWLLIIFFFF